VKASGALRAWPLWAVAIPVAVWVPIRLLGLERGYPLLPMMAFTPYVAVLALFACGLAVALRNWAAAALTGLATLCLLAAIVPRTIAGEVADPAGHETFTVLSANIHHGTADPAALMALVDRVEPDLLSVQELTPSYDAKLRRAGIQRRFPHDVLSLHGGASGAGLFSRLPLRRLPERARFEFRLPRALVTLPGGSRLRIVGVHPYPPKQGYVAVWRAALESLPAAGSGTPWILAGDFNATLDQAELRQILDRGYRDAGDVTGKGLIPTWPARWGVPPFVTIDHVLVDSRLGIASYAVDDIPGSDHNAVSAELTLP
jgi:endonuclease/exonuclease/phosphatase family metal-dependent hydrolase